MFNFLKDLSQGSVAGFGEAVKAAVSAFKADPTKVMELESALQQASMELEKSVIVAVNQTMQAEAQSEHWMQWSWRPCFGFTACGVLINNYVLLPYFKHAGLLPIEIPSEVWIMVMAVLGVAAWTRGTEKIEAVKKS